MYYPMKSAFFDVLPDEISDFCVLYFYVNLRCFVFLVRFFLCLSQTNEGGVFFLVLFFGQAKKEQPHLMMFTTLLYQRVLPQCYVIIITLSERFWVSHPPKTAYT